VAMTLSLSAFYIYRTESMFSTARPLRELCALQQIAEATHQVAGVIGVPPAPSMK